jgi:predicted LPLAT superfamily acyltransferase
VDALLAAHERIERGEVVAILGDRAISNEQTVYADFLGEAAPFPVGPFLAAAALKVPVALCFCLYGGGNRYNIYFEPFSELLVLNRRHRNDDLRACVQRYATRVEAHCKQNPYNWFNFYNFWERPPLPLTATTPADAA